MSIVLVTLSFWKSSSTLTASNPMSAIIIGISDGDTSNPHTQLITHQSTHSTLYCGDGGHKEHCWGLAAAVFMANCEIYVKLKFVEQKQIQGMPALSVCARSKARDSDLCMWIYFLSASWKVDIFVRLVVMPRLGGGGGGGLVNVLFFGEKGSRIMEK